MGAVQRPKEKQSAKPDRAGSDTEFTDMHKKMKENRDQVPVGLSEGSTKQKRTRSLEVVPPLQPPRKSRPVSEPARQEASSSGVVSEPRAGSNTPTMETDEEMADFSVPMSPEPEPCKAPGPTPEPQVEGLALIHSGRGRRRG